MLRVPHQGHQETAEGGEGMISAKVVADSINPAGVRLTTFECVVPKWLIAEINTHAMIRRNSASSRAIPTVVLIEKVLTNPYVPVEWRYRAREGGMQAGALMTPEDAAASTQDWLDALTAILPYVERLEARKGAKEHINRLMEAWMYTVVVMTATEWENYLHLRGPSGGAQPEFKSLVVAQMAAFEASVPVLRDPRGTSQEVDLWHLPYVTDDERFALDWRDLPKLSAARSAGVSYYRPGARGLIEDEMARADRLVGNGHWTPLEKPCRATDGVEWFGPYRGWQPYRKAFGGESGSATHGTQEDAAWLRR